jgi:2-polyprenyl-6-methoxyphenol hydroxylase-like FAD-dependent oxidoreductase
MLPVLIVGGGPVGLSMALFLARQGVDCLLVERRSTTSPMPRATHVTRRSMELFLEAGLEPEIAAAGYAVVTEDNPRAVSDPDRTLPRVVLAISSIADLHRQAEILETGAEELAVPGPCPPYWCGQDRLEPILRGAAVRAGADVRFDHELVDLDLTETGATATIHAKRTGETLTRQTRYVIAADGASGRLADRAGITFTGLGAIARRLSILFRARLDDLVRDRRFFMTMIENPAFSGAVMRLNGRDRWAAAIDYSTTGESAEDFTPPRCLDLVRSAIGDSAVEVELDGVFRWEARHRVAETYRRGPLFLIGDAAHLHPPSGGFGSNVGFQDAHNLAWKLAGVLQGWAAESLLDTYDTERRPVGTATADQTLLLDGVPPDRLGGATPCDQRILIMGYRYDSPAVLGAQPGGPFPEPFDLSGAPGTRVPYVNTGWASTLDLVDRRFSVFAPDPAWRTAAERVRHELGVPLSGHTIELNATARFAASCGISSGGALLVRPDGFVAWRHPGPAADKKGLLASALRQLLGR